MDNDLVLASTEDKLRRELEQDRPSALGIFVPEGFGPRPSPCSGAQHHSWREKRRGVLLIQRRVIPVIASWLCQENVDSLAGTLGPLLGPALPASPSAIFRQCLSLRDDSSRSFSKCWTLWSSNAQIKTLSRGSCVKTAPGTASHRFRSIGLPPAFVTRLTELLFRCVTGQRMGALSEVGGSSHGSCCSTSL